MLSVAAMLRLDFCSPETVRTNVATVSEFAGVAPDVDTPAARKRAFMQALDHLQRIATPATVTDCDPVVVLVEDANSEVGAVAADLTADPATGGAVWPVLPVNPDERHVVAEGISAGMKLLKSSDPRFHELVCALVGCIVVATGSRLEGASKSSILGTIYMNPQPDWATARYGETILHETVHEAHFLDQMIHPWFALPHWEYEKRGICARSPIRQIPRPLPLTLEACCVATILVDFLWRVGENSRAIEMSASTASSLASIEPVREHLATRGDVVYQELTVTLAESDAFAAVNA